MRIIAGLAKGRRLFAPTGDHTRPSADRVREALFSVIMTRIPGAKVLDAFAGSGALGLEALSRGADSALFIEQDKNALKALSRNVENCRFTGAKIHIGNALHFLKQSKECYDIIFLDPPYHTDLLTQALTIIQDGHTLATGGLIVAETAKKASFYPPTGLAQIKTSNYGDTALYYLVRE